MDINLKTKEIMADFGWDSKPKEIQLSSHIARLVKEVQDECVIQLAVQKKLQAEQMLGIGEG